LISPTDAVTEALLKARRDHRPANADALADALNAPAQAYEVQRAVGRALGWFDGRVPMHWKSGGPSREVTLTHAPLPSAGVWPSPADARHWPFTTRSIEAEIALRLAHSVDAALAASLDRASAESLIDAMAVSIEIVDSRWLQGMSAAPLLRLADLQTHGALVLGDWAPYAPRDWTAQRCSVLIGERPPVERYGTHTLGAPTWGLLDWLLHATRDGAELPKGTVVTTGTWVGVLDAAPRERVRVAFEGIGCAEVQL
jgi:2-keto-4-pentenoate hydratase